MLQKVFKSNAQFRFFLFTFVFFGNRVILNLLLGPSRALAPDEDGYVETFKSIYELSENDGEFRSGAWWATSDFVLRAIYFPARILVFFGIEPQTALRIYSSMTAYVSFIAILHFGRAIFYSSTFWLTFIIANVPTVILWTTLGLRESFIFLSLTLLFLSIQGTNILKLPGKIAFGVGVGIFANVKVYLFIEFFFSLLVCFIVCLIVRKARKQAVIAIVFSSLFGFTFVLGNQPVVLSGVNYVKSISQERPDEQSNPQNFLSKEEPIKPSFNMSSSTTERLLDHKSNSTTLASKILLAIKSNHLFYSDKYENANLSPTNLSEFDKFIKSSINFLLYPNFFRDNGTVFLNVLGVFEFPFWLMIYIYFITSIALLRWNELSYSMLLGLVTVLVFIGVSATIETNIGTALRHRFVLILFLYFLILEATKILKSRTRKSHEV